MASTKQKKTSSKKTATASRNAAPAKAASAAKPVRREIWAVVCFFIGLFSLIGYFKVDALFITYFCGFIKSLIGYGYWLFPVALLICAFLLMFHRGRPVLARTICMLLVPFVFGALVHVIVSAGAKAEAGVKFSALVSSLWSSGGAVKSGGVLAGLLAIGLKKLVSIYGALPVLMVAFVALIMVALQISPATIAEKIKNRERRVYEPEPVEEESPGKMPNELMPEKSSLERVMIASQARKNAKAQRHAIDIPMDDETIAQPEAYEEKKVGFFNTNPRVKTPDSVLRSHVEAAREEKSATAAAAAAAAVTEHVKPLDIAEAANIAGVTITDPADMLHTEEFSTAQVREMRSNAKKSIQADELQSETDEVAKAVEEKNAAVSHVYNAPPVSLLRHGSGNTVDGREEMNINSERLQATLDSFGVSASIKDITRGPTVTRYDVELETGVKLSKLTNLAGDLALSLGVTGVRIAPIPDKISTVGIEVPNKIVSTVYLGDIIDSDAFRSGASKLTFALGKDIGGNAIVGNIAKLPHLLIAGTTGSGKSVCMNSLILSLLYKASPEEVRLIMIDPKMVELGIYNGIPHLYVPVVTDPKKAAGSLQWAVVEMLKRYRLFSEAGIRDLAAYNTMQKKNGEPILPQVVVVIDELADLMMTAAKEVEESICRVAQMGRAAGIHLVIATQRPSADVITGLMKANIPSRIAFAVSSAMESRIIMDQTGAEKLVGSGDMLYAPLGVGKPVRIQGAFVSDDEREEVVNFIKQYGDAEYSDEIMAAIDKAAEDKNEKAHAESVDEPGGGDYDELLPQAVEVIFETKQASVSMLQRRLKLGYSRAARIVDQMEEIGVVGPFEGSKPRQILITREQWLERNGGQGAAGDAAESQMAFADLEAEEAPWREEEED